MQKTQNSSTMNAFNFRLSQEISDVNSTFSDVQETKLPKIKRKFTQNTNDALVKLPQLKKEILQKKSINSRTAKNKVQNFYFPDQKITQNPK